MANNPKPFFCPTCFHTFPKDDSMLILTSGAAVIGGGTSWHGNLKDEISKLKRVVYCKDCRSPIDFHALLLGKLDRRTYPYNIGFLVILLSLAFCIAQGLSFWLSLGIGVAIGWLVGYALDRVEKRRLTSYRLTKSQVKELTGK